MTDEELQWNKIVGGKKHQSVGDIITTSGQNSRLQKFMIMMVKNQH